MASLHMTDGEPIAKLYLMFVYNSLRTWQGAGDAEFPILS